MATQMTAETTTRPTRPATIALYRQFASRQAEVAYAEASATTEQDKVWQHAVRLEWEMMVLALGRCLAQFKTADELHQAIIGNYKAVASELRTARHTYNGGVKWSRESGQPLTANEWSAGGSAEALGEMKTALGALLGIK